MQFITENVITNKVNTGMTSVLRGSSEHEYFNTDVLTFEFKFIKMKKGNLELFKDCRNNLVRENQSFKSVLISANYFFSK